MNKELILKILKDDEIKEIFKEILRESLHEEHIIPKSGTDETAQAEEKKSLFNFDSRVKSLEKKIADQAELIVNYDQESIDINKKLTNAKAIFERLNAELKEANETIETLEAEKVEFLKNIQKVLYEKDTLLFEFDAYKKNVENP